MGTGNWVQSSGCALEASPDHEAELTIWSVCSAHNCMLRQDEGLLGERRVGDERMILLQQLLRDDLRRRHHVEVLLGLHLVESAHERAP